MNVSEVKRKLMDVLGNKSICLDNAFFAAFPDDTQIYLEYVEEKDELYLLCHIASITEERLEKYALSLLKANHLGAGTGGSAVLAYDAEEGRVVLWDKFALAPVCEREFMERLSCLYLSKLHWANKMRDDILGGDPLDPKRFLGRVNHG